MWPFNRKRKLTKTQRVDFSHEALPSILVSRKEYESPERNGVFSFMKRHGWELENENWFLAGAQEIIVWRFSKNGQRIFLHNETYCGVRLHAPEATLKLFEEIRVEEKESPKVEHD